jgi:hypothetical protein
VTTVPGDPASVSACGLTVREVARRLEDHATGLRTAYREVGEQWAGRESAGTRRAGAALADAVSATGSELDRVGRVLQDHATDLADLVARARSLEERARAAGLEVRDGQVAPAWGVTGAADAGAAHARDVTREALQADLDLVLAQHRRRRDWVLEVLRDSTATLAGVSLSLRQG